MTEQPGLEQVQAAPIERGAFDSKVYFELLGRILDTRKSAYLLVSDGSSEKCAFFPVGGVRLTSQGLRQGRVLSQALAKHPEFGARFAAVVRRLGPDGNLETAIDDPAERKVLHAVSRDLVRDELIDLVTWDGAEYEFCESNPPARIFDLDMEATKLSLGVKAVLEEVRDAIKAWDGKLARRLAPTSTRLVQPGQAAGRAGTSRSLDRAILATIAADEGTVADVLLAGRRAGRDAIKVGQTLCQLADTNVVQIGAAGSLPAPARVKRARRENDAIEAAIQRMINELRARRQLAQNYMVMGDEDKAVDNLRQVGEALAERGDREAAVDVYREILGMVPDAFFARERVAGLFEQMRRFPEAVQEWLGLARRYASFRLFNRSKQRLARAIQLEPQNPDHRRRLVDLLLAMGSKREAAEQCEQLGQFFEAQGDKQAAAAAYQRALFINPDDGEVETRLAAVAPGPRGSPTSIAALVLFVALIAGAGFFVEQRYQAWQAFQVVREAVFVKVGVGEFSAAREELKTFAVAQGGFQVEVAQLEQAILGVEEVEAEGLLAAAGALEGQDLQAARQAYAEVLQRHPATQAAGRARNRAGELEAREQAARELLVAAEEALQQEDVAQALARGRELLTRFPGTEAALAVRLPLVVGSDPPRANLDVGGQRAGVTPREVAADAEGEFRLELTLSLTRYHTRRLELDLREPSLTSPLTVELSLQPEWSQRALGPFTAQPTLGSLNSVLAVGARDRRVRLIDERGRLRWEQPLPPFSQQLGPLFAGEGRVFGLFAPGRVVAWGAERGQVLWEVTPELTAPRLVGLSPAGGPILVGDEGFLALDPPTGDKAWGPAALPRGPLAVDPHVEGSYLILTTTAGEVRGYDLRQAGKATFAVKSGGRPSAPPTRCPGGFLVAQESGVLVLVGRDEVWRRELPTAATVKPVFSEEGQRVLVAAGEELLALSLEGGEIQWRSPLGAVAGGLCAQGGRVFVTTDDGRALAFSEDRGERRWEYRGRGGLSAPVAIRTGVVVAGEDGQLSGLPLN